MTVRELCALLRTPARSKAVKAMASASGGTVCGVAGSSAAVMLGMLPAEAGRPVLVVGDSLDDAGYLYHDLCRVAEGGEAAVAMFPSGYKRDIKYGQADEAARILRTEALNRIADTSGSLLSLIHI